MKTINLEDYQYDFLINCLEQYRSQCSLRICDDLDQDLQKKIEPYQEQISKEYAYFNNPKEPDGPDKIYQEGMLVFWLQKKIESQT